MKKDKAKRTEEVKETCKQEQPEQGDETPEMITVEKQALEEASRQFEEAKAKQEEYLNLLKRVQAEFENYKKRNASLRLEAQDDATRRAVEGMLPTLDNLKRALEAAAQEHGPLKDGVQMVLRGFEDALQKLGMEELPCEKGDAFDPDRHNAVMVCDAEEKMEAGCIAEVLQKGYMVKDKVVRYAMVKVAQ